jgi:hypothetical protein
MMKLILCSLFAFTVLFVNTSSAQLPRKWIGNWSGTMHLFSHGELVDSVAVSFVVRPLSQNSSYTWKMEFNFATMRTVQDYTLHVRDAAKGLFVIDEGSGIELACSLVGDKMYSLFEVQNTMFSVCYELKGDELIFEVTSGNQDPPTGGGVTTYSAKNLQRVVFRRAPLNEH